MSTSDHPEVDDTGFLNQEEHAKFRMLIGCAQWAVILGRMDIMYTVQTLARFSAAPRQGHLSRALRMFGYLKNYPKYGITFTNAQHPLPDFEKVQVNWNEQYPGAFEEIPPNLPEPKGELVDIVVYVDADHATDLETRRSVTGFILFINHTPIKWYSKKQNTVETSTYGAE